MSVVKVCKHLILMVFFVLNCFISLSQQNLYDTDLLPPSFHRERRELLREKLPHRSTVILFSNPVRNRSNDVDYTYSQDPDFYYLTGLTEPNSALIIFSEPVKVFNVETNEVIFVQKRDKKDEMWNGVRLGVKGVEEKLGFQTVFVNRKYLEMEEFLRETEYFFVKYPTDINTEIGNKSSLNRYVKQTLLWTDNGGRASNSSQLTSFLAAMREIKTSEELVLLKKAITITCKGIEEAIKQVKPGMTEYQAQAIAEYHFRYSGSEYQGYGSICGSGNNTIILHYIDNRKTMEDGDLLLMDIGAEYHGYTADVTRTIPVNGRFTKEQKIIYDLVLKAQLAGIQNVKKGQDFNAAHKVCKSIIDQGLRDLHITDRKGGYARYFMHGTSHFLGLEVHDAGLYGKLRPGTVITVEPGIYIPEGSPCDSKWWGIGVRIEDDVLVTEADAEVLSGHLAKTTLEIEKLMSLENDGK
jgi:Xaa-Pro aminopeptidase